MRKIINPYTQIQRYYCFGCAPNNSLGLKMEFYEDDDFICCDWQPSDSFQGYKGVLHGGIQQSLMDEIASWVVQTKLKTAGVTSKMETRFLKPVAISNRLHLKARLQAVKKVFAEIDVCLYNEDNVLCSKAVVTYYTFGEDEARDKFYYPGHENFFDTHLV